MDHADIPENGHAHEPLDHAAPPAGQTLFPDWEWQSFREEDMHAGKRVVGLMVSIFIIGLGLYIGVATWVLNRV